MTTGKISQVRVARYAHDGGYAAVEWLRAFQGVEIPADISDGDGPAIARIGVQINKKRAIDVILRIEKIESLADRVRARLGRTSSDALFKDPAACRARVPSAQRPLAVLAARHMGAAVRILVCQPREDAVTEPPDDFSSAT
ncbi:MAG: hypothetical protein WD114_00300 [Phycisphaerales bacterium]